MSNEAGAQNSGPNHQGCKVVSIPEQRRTGGGSWFSKARTEDGGSWVVDFGTEQCSVKYGTTHTNTITQKAEHSPSSNC